jgi:acyl-CoA thioester hydrolase
VSGTKRSRNRSFRFAFFSERTVNAGPVEDPGNRSGEEEGMDRYWHAYPWRVRYSETDQMGVVYHANYANWFEIGRTELIRELGITYAEIERRGLVLPLTELTIRYKQPARYDDFLEIRTAVASCSTIRLVFDVQVVRDGQVLAEGTTHHVWLNRDWKPVRLDKVYPELFELIKSQVP